MDITMQLTDLIATLNPVQIIGPNSGTLAQLRYDSRRVMVGDVFFALPGDKTDGRKFIADAIALGAQVVVAETELDLPADVTGLVVHNARLGLAHAAAAQFGHPTRDLPVIGVTGTNGKTTVTYLLEAILRTAGYRPAVLGTVNYRFENEERPAPHTTPEALDLLRTFSDFRALGADALIIEVSSHALAQHRVAGVEFDVGVFTNLTPEHLDYHQDMDDYFTTKRSLFSEHLPKSGGRAVINCDDSFGARLAGEFDSALTCGNGGNVQLTDAEISLTGIHGMLRTPAGTTPLSCKLLGEFNRSNLECAAGAAIALGIEPADIAAGIAGAASSVRR
jgi:UDP-N-acetylmuramoyl-L-alanyl-D-glutamate--2,6-diaminopimelate ligase